MKATPSSRLPRTLLAALLAYCAASLLHFVHNAEFLVEYPNMPTWLTRAQVYSVWLAITGIGLFGALLARFGHRIAGLGVIAVYAILGFDGLGHYTRAPVSAHTAMMNATIWLEVFAAASLLAIAASLLAKQLRAR